MSIIAEALKKAQQSSKKKANSAQLPPSPEPKENFLTIIAGTSKPIRFASLGIALFLVGFLVILFHQSTQPLKVKAKEELKEAPKEAIPLSHIARIKKPSVQGKNPVATLKSPVTLNEVNDSIKLSGIMYTPQKPLAVINGNIWGVGDYIGKFEIVSIYETYIKVSVKDQEFIVKLKR